MAIRVIQAVRKVYRISRRKEVLCLLTYEVHDFSDGTWKRYLKQIVEQE